MFRFLDCAQDRQAGDIGQRAKQTQLSDTANQEHWLSPYRHPTPARREYGVTGPVCVTKMKMSIFNTMAMITSFSVAFSPILCHAHALDPQLDCKSTAHAFIAPLLDAQSIDPKPMRVEANSVNAFRAAHGSNLTAFGFHVYAVFGFEQHDAIFKQGSGQPIAASAYGVVVTAPAESVKASARQAGSEAVIREVIPLLLTAVYCKGP